MPQRNWSKPTLLRRMAQTVAEMAERGEVILAEDTSVESIMLDPSGAGLDEITAADLFELIRSAVIVEAIRR